MRPNGAPALRRATRQRAHAPARPRRAQLGLTFSDAEGNLPVVDGCFSAWQFNFREFDVAADMYAADSIELLRHSGIDFAAHAARGIDTRRFGEALLVSGVVLIPEVRWITFHSGYDFGYLLKLVTCLPLPATEAEFFEVRSRFHLGGFGTFVAS
jgi:CCR4-NOT transcription complex subunit 7/8